MSKFFILSFILELEQHRSAMPGTDLFPVFFYILVFYIGMLYFYTRIAKECA